MALTKKERIKKYGEVFTPPKIVKQMVDMIEPDVSKPETTVLEPACGTGNFLVELLERKLARCESDEERITALTSLYGVEIQNDNTLICRTRMIMRMPEHLREKAKEIVNRNILTGNFLKPEGIWFLEN